MRRISLTRVVQMTGKFSPDGGYFVLRQGLPLNGSRRPLLTIAIEETGTSLLDRVYSPEIAR